MTRTLHHATMRPHVETRAHAVCRQPGPDPSRRMPVPPADERIKFSGDWTSRVGCRFNLSDSISLDLSVARTGPRAAPAYGFGFNHDFVR